MMKKQGTCNPWRSLRRDIGNKCSSQCLTKREKWSDEILPTLTLSPGCLGFDGPFGSLPTQDIYELLKERISSFLSSRERSLMLKRKGRDQQLCPWGRRRAVTPLCLPAQCPGSVAAGLMGSAVLCVCMARSAEPSITAEGGSDILLPVHRGKQILNPLFPNFFWNRRQPREAGPWSHRHKGLSPGLDEAPCPGSTGEQMCGVSCSRGRTPTTPEPSCLHWYSKRFGWHLLCLEHPSTQMYLLPI